MQTDHDDWREKNQEFLDSSHTSALSLIEVVLAASECSEDEGEIFDLVDDMVTSGRARLASLDQDPAANF